MERKKQNPVIWGILLTISLSCYVYLSTTKVPSTLPLAGFSTAKENPGKVEGEERRVFLPDLAILQAIINLTKMIIPGN